MKLLLLLAVLTGPEAPKSGDGMVCEVVRGYVAIYGERAAREFVRKHKWASDRVAAAEKCLVRKGPSS